MKKRRSLLGAVVTAAIAAVLIGSATEVRARTLDCQCITFTQYFSHIFDDNGNLAYMCDTPGCHEYAVCNYCSSEHAGCGQDFAEAVLDLEDVVRSPARALAAAQRSNVVYNPDREALQVLGCAGEVVASIRVQGTVRTALLVRLMSIYV